MAGHTDLRRHAAPGGHDLSDSSTALKDLARLYGVQTSYRDAWGRTRRASRDALVMVLRALGAELDRPENSAAALATRRRELSRRPLPPVVVSGNNRTDAMPRPASGPLACRLRLEDGEEREWSHPPGRPIDLGALPLGYHDLCVETGGDVHHTRIIAAPERLAKPPRAWGVFLPLHALRTDRSWGTGDLTDLSALTDLASRWGASVVSTLPLLAAFLDDLFDPSPYAPASRLFWNELYVDPERAPELAESPEARDLLESPDFRVAIEDQRRADLVDYRTSFAAKRRVLELLSSAFFERAPDRRRADLDRFLERRPLADDYAMFRGITSERGKPWYEWEDGRDLRRHRIDGSSRSRPHEYHLYAQLLAEEQMEALAGRAARRDVRLHLDLPVGSHPASYDSWRFETLFAHGATVGAPPDAFFAGGQDWGSAPMRPEAGREDGHRYTSEVFRHICRHAGVVRIDHVMGMHRLYWIPEGMRATDGVYVRYPADELYAVLMLEASRHDTAIVGEDLGTVPSVVRASMRRRGILRSYVLPFELPASGSAPSAVPSDAVALTGTHDTPTFREWWSSLEDGTRGALAKTLDGAAFDALRMVLSYLALSEAAILLVNLEDLWGETRRQNLPGSSMDEHPSWRHRAARTLESIADDPHIADVLGEIDALRAKGGPSDDT